ncbi:hypothetical protein CCUS01_11378 [Colletotrichum cuscutae]|uniref:Uncharacterized protein n=1 Tax=Colletotrichum cuscutae TaxID=1209917 RepID=A0AAI9U5A4_9PEZI|nr:hypothetical protein CCUS01_11378 [Colletotrichum cuscutae]
MYQYSDEAANCLNSRERQCSSLRYWRRLKLKGLSGASTAHTPPLLPKRSLSIIALRSRGCSAGHGSFKYFRSSTQYQREKEY